MAAARAGDQAFARLAGWTQGQFKFEPQVPAPQKTIDKPLDRLLADSARAASEREAIRRVVPSMDVVPSLSRKAPAPSVTLDARDWELRETLEGDYAADINRMVLTPDRGDDWIFGISAVAADGSESPVASAVPGGDFHPLAPR